MLCLGSFYHPIDSSKNFVFLASRPTKLPAKVRVGMKHCCEWRLIEERLWAAYGKVIVIWQSPLRRHVNAERQDGGRITPNRRSCVFRPHCDGVPRPFDYWGEGMGESLRIKILANRLTTKTLFLRTGVSPIFKLACFRRSDSRARKKNSRREKNENKEQLETVRAQRVFFRPRLQVSDFVWKRRYFSPVWPTVHTDSV